MTRFAMLCVALVLWTARIPLAQEPSVLTPGDLVSSWTLTAVERGVTGEKPERIQNPRGLLIFDAAGHAFEFVTTASRQQPETPQADPLGMFGAYGGFWGGYRVNVVDQQRITFKAEGAISLSMMGREFSRSFQQAGDRLTMTSIDEPHTQGGIAGRGSACRRSITCPRFIVRQSASGSTSWKSE